MRTKREAKRFQCPRCKKAIELIEVDPKARPISDCDLVAICRRCDRVFTAEEWHRRHGPFDPYQDADV
jgi:transcription elongation factor Elf1